MLGRSLFKLISQHRLFWCWHMINTFIWPLPYLTENKTVFLRFFPLYWKKDENEYIIAVYSTFYNILHHLHSFSAFFQRGLFYTLFSPIFLLCPKKSEHIFSRVAIQLCLWSLHIYYSPNWAWPLDICENCRGWKLLPFMDNKPKSLDLSSLLGAFDHSTTASPMV